MNDDAVGRIMGNTGGEPDKFAALKQTEVADRTAPGGPEEGNGQYEPVHTSCPGPCAVHGSEVYRAAAHSLSCRWMMSTARRCREHDELLMPSEKECPAPDVPEAWYDPHNRTGVRPPVPE